MDTNRTKTICDLIKMVWSSLDSHLEWTYVKPKKEGEYFGGISFQKKCVKEYADIIKKLSDLL